VYLRTYPEFKTLLFRFINTTSNLKLTFPKPQSNASTLFIVNAFSPLAQFIRPIVLRTSSTRRHPRLSRLNSLNNRFSQIRFNHKFQTSSQGLIASSRIDFKFTTANRCISSIQQSRNNRFSSTPQLRCIS
jgi:hypothetical protein